MADASFGPAQQPTQLVTVDDLVFLIGSKEVEKLNQKKQFELTVQTLQGNAPGEMAELKERNQVLGEKHIEADRQLVALQQKSTDEIMRLKLRIEELEKRPARGNTSSRKK